MSAGAAIRRIFDRAMTWLRAGEKATQWKQFVMVAYQKRY